MLVLGAVGKAMTSTRLMFLSNQDPNNKLTKLIKFSLTKTPGYSIDKRGGKNFGQPNENYLPCNICHLGGDERHQ